MTAIPIARLDMAASFVTKPMLRHWNDAKRQQKFPWRNRRGRALEGFCAALRRRHNLSGIEDVLRIERFFRRTPGVERLISECGLQVFLLALANAVLAGAGAAHRLGAFDQPVHELLAAGHLVGIIDVADQRAMEIAVADMADD